MPQSYNNMSNMSQKAATLFDLPPDASRWPRNNGGWCGEPATHNVYCEQHYQNSCAKNQRDPSPVTDGGKVRRRREAASRALLTALSKIGY
jgi:hypothetical protein